MGNTLQRLSEYIEYKGLSVSSFEKQMKFSNGSLASQIKNNKTIGVDKLENILQSNPDLSAEWLLTGKGEMILVAENDNHTRIINKANHDEVINKGYVDNDAPLYLERQAQKKIALEFMRGQDERSQIYQNINTLLNFQYVIMNLDHRYFESIDKGQYNVAKYYNGKTFDFEKYRQDIILEIDKVKDFLPALKNIVFAIEQFYKEVQPVDTKNVIGGFLTGTF